jgi:hypothetical protein
MAEATKASANSTVEPGTVEELTRLVALFLKYWGVPQGVLVHDMTTAGFSVGRIADLIQTTPNNVSQVKRKARPKWPAS